MVIGAGNEATSRPQALVVRRILTYLPGSVVPAALTMATTWVFTRLFDPVELGVYSLMLVVATPARTLFTQWLIQSIARYVPMSSTLGRQIRISQAMVVSLAAIVAVESLIGTVGILVSNRVVAEPWRSYAVPLVIFVVASSVFEVLAHKLAAENRARDYSLLRLVDSALTFLLRMLMVSALVGMDLRLMFWSVVASNVILTLLFCGRTDLGSTLSVLRATRAPEVTALSREFLAFGIPMTMWFFSSVLLDVGDRYVLNVLLGPGSVGVYDANYRIISGLAALMMVPITITLHPFLMNLSGIGDDNGVARSLEVVVENLLIGGALCVGLVVVFHPEIARLLLGPQFRGGSVVMAPVLAGVIVFNIGSFAHKPFEIAGQSRVMAGLGLAAGVANIGLCFVLIPVTGFSGAAYATLASYALYTVMVGFWGRRLIRWRLNMGAIGVRLAGIGTVVLLIVLFRRVASFAPYIIELSGAALLSAALCALVLLPTVRALRKASV